MNNRSFDLTIVKVLTLFSVLITASCAYENIATQLNTPKYRDAFEPYYSDIFTPDVGQSSSASIGDIVVSFERNHYRDEIVSYRPPAPLLPLPSSGWIQTHEYLSSAVYSHPEYYDGDVGAVLDEDEKVIAFVQVGGAKKGRKWLAPKDDFFAIVGRKTDVWKIRYSGRDQGSYNFEIVDERDQKATLATQTFKVSEAEFLEGFTVRGVFIRGATSGKYGTINYTIHDFTGG